MKCYVLVLSILLIAMSEASPAFVSGIGRDVPNFHTAKGLDTGSQLQPEGYNNQQHHIPNLFEYEAIYVENNHLLVWNPVSGEWRLHKVNRECGEDCPIIEETVVSRGFWPDRKFHKLVFMGCHSTTGKGHMLQIQVSTGNYSVWFFDHKAKDPMLEKAAWHQRLELSQFDLTYTGRDEVLLHDSVSGQFRVYLVEPRLPMISGEDPIGPFEALDQGTLPLKEQIVYLGNNHIMDYSATTGQYSLYLYDRGAMASDPVFSHVMEEGSIVRDVQLTYLAENQVLAVDPFKGNFKAFTVYKGTKFIEDDVVYYGHGTLMEGEYCGVLSSCSSCISRDGCGWCSVTDSCMRGATDGPCATNCTNWELHLCPGEPCHTHVGCSACLKDPFCGWCSDSNTCTEGSMDGPLFGSCEYSKMECPQFVRLPDEEVACEGEIQ